MSESGKNSEWRGSVKGEGGGGGGVWVKGIGNT